MSWSMRQNGSARRCGVRRETQLQPKLQPGCPVNAMRRRKGRSTGAPPGTRTPNPRIKRGMLGVSGRSACSDSTRKRSGSTRYTGIWPVLVPQPVPRPHGQHSRMHHRQSPIVPQAVAGFGTVVGGRHGDQRRERPARMPLPGAPARGTPLFPGRVLPALPPRAPCRVIADRRRPPRAAGPPQAASTGPPARPRSDRPRPR